MTEKQTNSDGTHTSAPFHPRDPYAYLRERAAAGGGGLWGGLDGLTEREARWAMIERLRVLSDAQLMEEAKSIIYDYWDDCYWLRYGGDCDAPARMMWRRDQGGVSETSCGGPALALVVVDDSSTTLLDGSMRRRSLCDSPFIVTHHQAVELTRSARWQNCRKNAGGPSKSEKLKSAAPRELWTGVLGQVRAAAVV